MRRQGRRFSIAAWRDYAARAGGWRGGRRRLLTVSAGETADGGADAKAAEYALVLPPVGQFALALRFESATHAIVV